MTGLFNTSSLRAQRSNPERHKETAERISPPPPSPPPDQLLRHPVGHRRRRRPAHPAFGPDIGEPVGDLPDAALDLLAAPLPSDRSGRPTNMVFMGVRARPDYSFDLSNSSS